MFDTEFDTEQEFWEQWEILVEDEEEEEEAEEEEAEEESSS